MAKVTTSMDEEIQQKRDEVTARTVQLIDHILDHGVLLTPDGLGLTDKGLKVAQLLDGLLGTMQRTINQELEKLFPKFPS